MPTPAAYRSYSSAVSRVWSRHRGKLIAAITVIAFSPAILERMFPRIGPVPGRVLFVFMLAYFAALAPALAFRRELPDHPWSNGFAIWAWLRAAFCSALVASCAWFVWAAFESLH